MHSLFRSSLLLLFAGRVLCGGLLRLIPMMVPVVVRNRLCNFFWRKLGWAAKMQNIVFNWGVGFSVFHVFLLFQGNVLLVQAAAHRD